MPPLMLQWRLLHITIFSMLRWSKVACGAFDTLAKGATFASLSAIASTGWAADAPLCPSQPTPPVAQSPTATPAAPAESPKEQKPGLKDGAIDIHSDHATLGADGNASLQGNVS